VIAEKAFTAKARTAESEMTVFNAHGNVPSSRKPGRVPSGYFCPFYSLPICPDRRSPLDWEGTQRLAPGSRAAARCRSSLTLRPHSSLGALAANLRPAKPVPQDCAPAVGLIEHIPRPGFPVSGRPTVFELDRAIPLLFRLSPSLYAWSTPGTFGSVSLPPAVKSFVSEPQPFSSDAGRNWQALSRSSQ
jgi:hypothetical protein